MVFLSFRVICNKCKAVTELMFANILFQIILLLLNSASSIDLVHKQQYTSVSLYPVANS